MHRDARQQRIRVATGHHARPEVVAVEELPARFVEREPFALTQLPHEMRVDVAVVGACRIVDGDALERDPAFTRDALDGLADGPPDWMRDGLVHEDGGRADDPL